MPPSVSEHHRRLQVISVSAAALRRRVDALTSEGTAAGAEDGGPSGREVQAALSEAKRLMGGLKPLVAVAEEFRLKWQRQRRQLLAQREAEIERTLRQEREARLEAAEAEAKEELAVVRRDSEQRARAAALAASREQEGELQVAVGAWRERTPGAESVRASDVGKAVGASVARLGAWASEQETRLVRGWRSEVAEIVTRVHSLDEEAMVALEETHAARRSVLDGSLRRQRREVSNCRDELQERLASLARAFASSSSSAPSRPPSQRASEAAALARAARSRVEKAKLEAEAATEAHLKKAVAEFDAFASEGLLRRQAFRSAVVEASPMLRERLDKELEQLAQAAKAGMDAHAARSSFATHQAAETPVAVGLRGSATSTPSGSPRASPRSSASGVPDEQDTAARTAKRSEQIAQLRERLKAAQAALSKGNWNCDWRRDIAEVSDLGLPRLRFAEAAVEKQTAVLRGPGSLQEDAAAMASAAASLKKISDAYVEGVHREFVRIRNAKVALARARSALVQETTRRVGRTALEAEEAVLPAVTKLAHEAETLREIGYAVRRGAQRLPVGAVAGAWRRTVATSLPVLERLWDAANVPEEDRRQVVCQLLALLERQAGSASLLQRERMQQWPQRAPRSAADVLGHSSTSSVLAGLAA